MSIRKDVPTAIGPTNLGGIDDPDLKVELFWAMEDGDFARSTRYGVVDNIGPFACSEGMEFVQSGSFDGDTLKHYFVIQDRVNFEEETDDGIELMEVSFRAHSDGANDEVIGMRIGEEIDDLRGTEVLRILEAIFANKSRVKSNSKLREEALAKKIPSKFPAKRRRPTSSK